MISATVLAIFFVPLFFVLIRRRFPGKSGKPVIADIAETAPADTH